MPVMNAGRSRGVSKVVMFDFGGTFGTAFRGGRAGELDEPKLRGFVVGRAGLIWNGRRFLSEDGRDKRERQRQNRRQY